MARIELPHSHSDINQINKLSDKIIDNHSFDITSEFFKMLSDTTRLRIFWLLCHFEECVTDISAIIGVSSPAVSHHLKALKEGGLVVGHREGKEMCYSAAKSPECRLLHQMIEQIMEIKCPREQADEHTSLAEQELLLRQQDNKQSYQIQAVHSIHDYLLEHIGERITIDELSRLYHINPTTIKQMFKSVYGVSIAAHIREHRMEQAQIFLKNTDMSILQVANAVGYESQSKFTAVFKELFGVLPSDVRRNKSGG